MLFQMKILFRFHQIDVIGIKFVKKILFNLKGNLDKQRRTTLDPGFRRLQTQSLYLPCETLKYEILR